jgi:hypothetical protein
MIQMFLTYQHEVDVQVDLYHVIARHEAIANYADRLCQLGIASCLAMTRFFSSSPPFESHPVS